MATDSVNIDPSLLTHEERKALCFMMGSELRLPEMPVAALWLVSKKTARKIARNMGYSGLCDCDVCIALRKLGIRR